MVAVTERGKGIKGRFLCIRKEVNVLLLFGSTDTKACTYNGRSF